MNRRVEHALPYAISVAVVLLYLKAGIEFPKCRDILSASITLGAVFTGFLATLKSIIVSLNSRSLENFRKTKYWGALLGYLREAIWASLLLCVISMMGFFMDPQHPREWFEILWLFTTTASICTFLRVSNLIMHLITI
jgi:hypothetical protein